MNTVSCACPPLHPHPSRVDLVLRYNLYLTTVMYSCFSSFLLLFHLGCACVKGACLTCDCISPGRSRFISSCCLVLTLPGSQSMAALQHRLCVGQRRRRVAQRAATSPKYPSPPCLPPCCLCSQALRQSEVRLSLGQEYVEFVGALLPLHPALGCSSAAGGSHSGGDVRFHLSFASSPLFCSPVSGVGVQCFATPSKAGCKHYILLQPSL